MDFIPVFVVSKHQHKQCRQCWEYTPNGQRRSR